MGIVTTEAWVLHRAASEDAGAGTLKRESFSFPDIGEDEVLVEPIYGSWEGNMTHALERDPVDVCRLRREDRVVLGNSGVVRILRTGVRVTKVSEGDLCLIAPTAEWDRFGYMLKVVGYDAPRSIGMLAKQAKLHERQVVPLPPNTRHALRQWAAFSVRYGTAWSNWKVAYGCWRLQISESELPGPFVMGWGGGTALAELTLAKSFGCRAAMMSSNESRLQLIQELDVEAIDRRLFPDLDFDDVKFQSDRNYRKSYLRSERIFLDIVREATNDDGVSIFVDNIGTPVLRATLRALGRQAVIASSGWKIGSKMSFSRIAECTNRHIHVHTHGARLSEAEEAVAFAEENGWVPPPSPHVYGWDDIPQLAHEYAEGRIETYFPVFQVNPL